MAGKRNELNLVKTKDTKLSHREIQRVLLDSFFEQLRGARQCVLMLDYDGTLAPFRVQRDQAVPYPGVREILGRILNAGLTRLIIVSGRMSREVVPLLGLPNMFEIWGSHGWDRYHVDGSWTVFTPSNHELGILLDAKTWLSSQGLASHVEMKPGCLALHWRGLGEDNRRILRHKVLDLWNEIVNRTNLELMEFDGGIELRLPGRNKGLVVKTVLDEMCEDAAAAYLGDDQTDEDAFDAIEGRGLSVLVRDEFRSTHAHVWLRPPEQLLEFLGRWHQAATGKS